MPTPSPRVAVAPTQHPWHDGLAQAVRQAGGALVEPADAEALIWLGKDDEDLRTVIHPGIRWVQLRAAGVEHWIESGEIDTERIFTSARGAYARSVAEHGLALILGAAKRLHTSARLNHWDSQAAEGVMLRGSTVGVIGAGAIGTELIRYLQPFDLDIQAITRSGRDVVGASRSLSADSLTEVWSDLDYVVILAPATDETKALIDADVISKLRDSAWIINLARGSLIDLAALTRAVQDHRIGGASLDVTDPEPLPSEHPLWSMGNVHITPHVANPKSNQINLLAAHIGANVQRFARGERLLGEVSLAAGY